MPASCSGSARASAGCDPAAACQHCPRVTASSCGSAGASSSRRFSSSRIAVSSPSFARTCLDLNGASQSCRRPPMLSMLFVISVAGARMSSLWMHTSRASEMSCGPSLSSLRGIHEQGHRGSPGHLACDGEVACPQHPDEGRCGGSERRQSPASAGTRGIARANRAGRPSQARGGSGIWIEFVANWIVTGTSSALTAIQCPCPLATTTGSVEPAAGVSDGRAPPETKPAPGRSFDPTGRQGTWPPIPDTSDAELGTRASHTSPPSSVTQIVASNPRAETSIAAAAGQPP
jgi:hypothetical protein